MSITLLDKMMSDDVFVPTWRRAWQPCCELQENSVLFVILLFYVLDVVIITVYDRHTLLNIVPSSRNANQTLSS